jgi:hypothetical protein
VHAAMKQCSSGMMGKNDFHVRIIGHSKGGGIAQIYLHGALMPDENVDYDNNWMSHQYDFNQNVISVAA